MKENKKNLSIWKVKLSIIGAIGLVSLIFAIIFSVMLIKEYRFTQSIKTNTKEILKDNSKNLYYLDYNGTMIADANYNNYLYSLSKIKGITYSGAFNTSSIYINELQKDKNFMNANKNIRKEVSLEIFKNNSSLDKYTYTFCISEGLYDLINLKLYKGNILKQDSKDEIPVVVGYNYKDVIKIGQSFSAIPGDAKYKVTGILDKNSTWIEENNLSEVGNHIQTAINLDNYFVIIYDNKYLKNNETVIFQNPTTYVYTDTKSSLNKINDLNKEYKQDFKAINMSDIYTQIDYNSIFNIKYEILRDSVAICITLLCIILWIYIFKHKPDTANL